MNSPFRDRGVEENLVLFEKMKNGEFEEGTHVLRAKIDMSSPNMLMRDPVMYRVLKRSHHEPVKIGRYIQCTTGLMENLIISNKFLILYARLNSNITENCTTGFSTRFMMKMTLGQSNENLPDAILSYTVMSKRKLVQLVQEGYVNGWDDPRMPTISGLRRRGYTPKSIRDFSESAGIAKRDNVTDLALLEFHIRNELNKTAPRVMAVLNPVKLVITNYPEGKEELFSAENNPEDAEAGFRTVPFSRELYIEQRGFQRGSE